VVVKALIERIRQEGRDLGGGILKVDGFLNHQLDPELTNAMGIAFKERFLALGIDGIDKVLTAEVSGIAPALTTGMALGVPVVYARKRRPITMPDTVLETRAPSHTKGGVTRLIVSPEYLRHSERVLIIDDFLASGRTLEALAGLVAASGAELCGIGCVIEKRFEGGRDLLAHLEVPLITLAVITAMDGEIELAEP
jgi:xanthine phosphoribosyltransferase